MLDYLNNDSNTVGSPNENYARELMELHTLGVDGGYTQQDVQRGRPLLHRLELLRRQHQSHHLRYTFRFNSGNHDNGQKIVLGNIIPAGGGQQDGRDRAANSRRAPEHRAIHLQEAARALLG